MRRYLPTLLAALLSVGLIGILLSPAQQHKRAVHTITVPETVVAPQLQSHPCDPANFYMQCAVAQPNLGLELRPPVASGAVFGIDFAWGGPSGSFAAAHGARFACSYLSDSSKDWRYSLLHSYPAAGAHTCSVWETSQYRALAGWGAGFADARAASAEAGRLGEAGADIYFAYDFDTSRYSCRSLCPYVQGADAAIGKARVGDYGGLNTVRTLQNARVVARSWQTLAWSFGTWDSRACIRQVSINNTWFGYSTDHDYLVCANAGLWPAAKPKPKPKPVSRAKRARWIRARSATARALGRDRCHNNRTRTCRTLRQRYGWFDRRIKANR